MVRCGHRPHDLTGQPNGVVVSSEPPRSPPPSDEPSSGEQPPDQDLAADSQPPEHPAAQSFSPAAPLQVGAKGRNPLVWTVLGLVVVAVIGGIVFTRGGDDGSADEDPLATVRVLLTAQAELDCETMIAVTVDSPYDYIAGQLARDRSADPDPEEIEEMALEQCLEHVEDHAAQEVYIPQLQLTSEDDDWSKVEAVDTRIGQLPHGPPGQYGRLPASWALRREDDTWVVDCVQPTSTACTICPSEDRNSPPADRDCPPGFAWDS